MKKLLVVFSISFVIWVLFTWLASSASFISDISPDLESFFTDAPHEKAIQAGGIYENAYDMTQEQIASSQVGGVEYAADYMNLIFDDCDVTDDDISNVLQWWFQETSNAVWLGAWMVASYWLIVFGDFMGSEDFVDSCNNIMSCSLSGEAYDEIKEPFGFSDVNECISVVERSVQRAQSSINAQDAMLTSSIGEDMFWNGSTEDSPFDLIEDIQNIDSMLFMWWVDARQVAFFGDNDGGLGDLWNGDGPSLPSWIDPDSWDEPWGSSNGGDIDNGDSQTNWENNNISDPFGWNGNEIPDHYQQHWAVFDQEDEDPDSDQIIVSLASEDGIQNQVCIDPVPDSDKEKAKDKLDETDLEFEPDVGSVVEDLPDDLLGVLNGLSPDEIEKLLQHVATQPFDADDLKDALSKFKELVSECDEDELEKQMSNLRSEMRGWEDGMDLLGHLSTFTLESVDTLVDAVLDAMNSVWVDVEDEKEKREEIVNKLCQCLKIPDMIDCDDLPFAERQSCKNEKLLQKLDCFCKPEVKWSWDRESSDWWAIETAISLSVCPKEPRKQNIISRDEEADSFEWMVDIINNVLYELKNSGELFKHNEAEGAMDTKLQDFSIWDVASFDIVTRFKDLYTHDVPSDEEKAEKYEKENERLTDRVYWTHDMNIESDRQRYIRGWDSNSASIASSPQLNLETLSHSIGLTDQYNTDWGYIGDIGKAYNQEAKFEILKSLKGFYEMNVSMWWQAYQAIIEFYNEVKEFEVKIKSST